MNKILVLSLALLSASASASTKDFGVYGGLNAAGVTSSPYTSGTAGLIVGGHAFLPLADKIEFVPSVQLAQRGFRRDDYYLGVDDVHFRTTYLEFLPLIRVMVPITGMDAYVTAGPNIGVKLGTSCDVTGRGDCTVTDSDSVNSTEVGLELGVGSDFVLSNTNEIGVELRLHMGLSKFLDGAIADGKNRGLAFLFHFNF